MSVIFVVPGFSRLASLETSLHGVFQNESTCVGTRRGHQFPCSDLMRSSSESSLRSVLYFKSIYFRPYIVAAMVPITVG